MRCRHNGPPPFIRHPNIIIVFIIICIIILTITIVNKKFTKSPILISWAIKRFRKPNTSISLCNSVAVHRDVMLQPRYSILFHAAFFGALGYNDVGDLDSTD